MNAFENRLAQANGRLKAGRVGVAIEQRGGRLLLRATLPPKPGSSKTKPFQQRLALSYRANPAGLKLAEIEAKKVGAQLDAGEFIWEPYQARVQPLSVADWVERFEADYFNRRRRSPESETTWRHDYQKVFDKLPGDAALTVQVLHMAIAATEPDTRTRKRFVDVCQRLARFAGLEVDFKPMKGSYSPAKVTPRNLPNDEAIAFWRQRIPNPTWQRVYGLLACYGLRPHEVFSLDFADFPLLQVGEGTKTGSRLIYPLYPEWASQWNLPGDLPSVSGKNNSDLGNRVTKAFRRYAVPFTPYDLRHAWAVRSISFGLDISLAAAQMGHSVKVHSEIYHAWITQDVHKRAYEMMLSNPLRPMPPCD
ncbi:MAG: site-specific integrase [Elainellaceae cyanobacterium]